MTTVFNFLQEKEPKESKLDYRSVYDQLKFEFNSNFSDVEKFEELQGHHLFHLEKEMARREDIIYENWQKSFEKVLPYKKPFFVNSDCVRDSMDHRNIFVAPAFSRSGRHIFVIQPGDSFETL